MSNRQLALIVHRDPELLRQLSEILIDSGLEVMAASNDNQALQRLGTIFVPDLLLTQLIDHGSPGPRLLTHLRANPLTRAIPVVVLASDDPEDRRASLRLGITHVVPPPYDPEELLLTTRLALEQHRDESLLSGSLAQLSVPDLVQTVQSTLRSGVITFRSGGRLGHLWFRGGQLIDAEISDGRHGKEAVFELVFWQTGSFEADFTEVSVPRRIEENTSYLLLEAMRRKDEASRIEDSPPNAALPDPPPVPPRPLRTVHRALTLLNVAASYAENHFDPILLEKRLERFRAVLAVEYPTLDRFAVGPGGRTAWTSAIDPDLDVELLVESVGRWLIEFFTDAERALPGRFSIRKLGQLTEAVQEDMETLGFYKALGLPTPVREDPR